MAVISTAASYSTGKIAYHNLLEDSSGTVTASSEVSGFEKENAYDWRVFNWWKATSTGDAWIQVAFGSAKTADYFAVAAHDLTDQSASIKLQYSTNNGSTWNDATTASTGSDNRIIFKTFDSISASYWRVFVSAPTAVASIGIVAFGDRIDLPVGFNTGFSPPALARKNEYETSMSNNGQFIGKSISRKTYTGDISLRLLEPGWVRNYWEPFIDRAETKPFFLSWDTASYSDEAVICWMEDRYRGPSYDSTQTMSVNLGFNAKR